MSRTVIITGKVGTDPEARHGKDADYVKFRFGTREYDESETWWFNILCYGKNAKLALDKIKVGDYLFINGRMLPPMAGKITGENTVIMYDFNWLNTGISASKSVPGNDFAFETFDDIPEIPYGE